jgi:hypothetical protein
MVEQQRLHEEQHNDEYYVSDEIQAHLISSIYLLACL